MRKFAHNRSHENHNLMTGIHQVNQDNQDLTKPGELYPSWDRDLHESAGRGVDGRPIKQGQQPRDTLVPSRRLISLVNQDATFVEAHRHLGIFPQVLYKLVRDEGVARVKQVTDFILSLALETPYFQTTSDGQYDPSPEGMRDRARKMLIGMVRGHRPIIDRYAGPSYFRKWPKAATS